MSVKKLLRTDPCRVCLDETYIEGINLDENKNILELFEFCFGFSIKIQNTPKTLCYKCKKTVQKYAKFKSKCIESEEYWKSFNNHSEIFNIIPKTEIKVEEFKCESSNDDKDNFVESLDHEIDGKECNILMQHKDTIIKKNKIKLIKSFECGKCKKHYSKQCLLMKHMKMKCCKRKYEKRQIAKVTLNALENYEKNAVSTFNCGLCAMTNCCDINGHLNEHCSNNDLKCQNCSYRGRDFADMTAHRFEHCSDKKLFCHICDRKKASLLSLQFHFRSVHLQKAGGLCSVCNKSFKKFKTWKRHERLHNDRSLFICDHCERRFVFRHEIKSHLVHHTDIKQFVCETCGKGFKRMWGLKDHIENVHSPQQPVKCQHCNKTYKSQSKLDLHLRNIAKDKPFVCEVCSKKFVSEKVLKKHMFWHTGERPFSCEVCGSRYKAKGQLNLHMRNHTGIMPYKCTDCSKSFPNSYQLRRHSSVHTGVRAHKCGTCDRSFHERKALLEHSAQHNGGDGVKLET